MGDEYRLRTGTPDALMDALCTELGVQGLIVTREKSGVSASWPDADPSVAKYGGHVQLFLERDGVFVLLNAVPRPQQFIELLQQALASRGFEVVLEEP